MKRKFDINEFLGFEPHYFGGGKPEPTTSKHTKVSLLHNMRHSGEWLLHILPDLHEMKQSLNVNYNITCLSSELFMRNMADRPVTYGFARTAFGIWQVNYIEPEGIVSVFRFNETSQVPPISERIGFGNRPYRRDDVAAQMAVDVAMGLRKERLALCLAGRPLQLHVWQALLLIPHGFVLSYEQLARLSGHTRAVRAVASCVARNEMGLIVPCHRIVRKSGDIGKYAWDPSLKLKLIEYEQEKRNGR